MDSLDRIIRQGGEEKAGCLKEWRDRYGHEWPVYCLADGKEISI